MFPLPNLVVFPQVVQPLHVFESRYVEMLEDAVADDKLLAMALLLPGWEMQYEARPPVAPFVCLGRVLRHSPTKDEQYNILLAGIARAKIINELPPMRSYREVEVEILQDIDPPVNDPETQALHAALTSTFRSFIPNEEVVAKQLNEVLDMQAKLGTLTDLISYSLPFDLAFRQVLLAELDVLKRGRLLLDQLRSEMNENGWEPRPFPPEFSQN